MVWQEIKQQELVLAILCSELIIFFVVRLLDSCWYITVYNILHCFVVVHRPWSQEERDIVMSKMSQFLLFKKVPGKGDIEPWLSNERRLSGRSWRNVKDFVRNTFVSKK